MVGQAEPFEESSTSSFSYFFFKIFQSLAGLDNFAETNAATQKGIRKQLAANYKFLARMTAMHETNHRWGEELVKAERDRVLAHDFWPQNYQKAIEMARNAGLIFPGGTSPAPTGTGNVAARSP